MPRAFAAEEKPRDAFCLESTEALLGEPLGRAYAEHRLPPPARTQVQEMARGLLAILREDVAASSLSTAARQEALAKLAAYDVKAGYPDTWAETSGLTIGRASLWSNVAAARRFNVAADRRRIGSRAGRERWELPPSSPAAYIDVQLNLMALPAGFLQPWAFDPAASEAVNDGAIGAGVAHDLTHAIDTLGAAFDASGHPRAWWTPEDRHAFDDLARCTVEQYGAYEVEPGVHLEGQRVLGEALGDLAGLRIAWRALQQSLQRHPVPSVEGLTPEQQFFVAWAQFRGGAETVELQREMVRSDAHAPSRFRVIGPLSNLPEFQQAFACAAGSPMVRPEERRCRSW